jgi:hypothetical protein
VATRVRVTEEPTATEAVVAGWVVTRGAMCSSAARDVALPAALVVTHWYVEPSSETATVALYVDDVEPPVEDPEEVAGMATPFLYLSA